jgi:hypothetical protein
VGKFFQVSGEVLLSWQGSSFKLAGKFFQVGREVLSSQLGSSLQAGRIS